MKEDYGIADNKTVLDSQLYHKRQQKVILPTMSDIKCLTKYLASERQKYFTKLNEGFEYETWINLSSCVLTSIQVFNRRRAGEIERVLLSDLNSVQSIEEQFDNDIFNTLSENGKEAARNFIRFVICGKRGRTVTVLVSSFIYECINLLIKHRDNANISPENQYIFALPGEKSKHLSACKLLREYSEVCGATKPETLRGTLLRKHIATRSRLLNFKENEITDLADYMGHSEKIHKDIYRQPLAEREIITMSRLLQQAQGDNDEDETVDVNEETNNSISKNNSEIETASSSDGEYIEMPEKSKHCMPRKKKINRINLHRRAWTVEEKEAMHNFFKTHIQNQNLPNKSDCKQAVVQHSILKSRTATQIKLWVSNMIKKQIKNAK